MAGEQKTVRCYTPEIIDQAIKIWAGSSVALMDIRNKTIERSSPLENYILPASMFIFTHGAPVSIRLNDEHYETGRYGLCHAGKGALLSIAPIEREAGAFLVLYRAEATPFYKGYLRGLMESTNPFTQLYGFTPANPVFFMEKFYRMWEGWSTKESTEQFHAKIMLYQVVHYLYKELKQGNVRYMEPDYVEWVKEHLDNHFAEPISIEKLSDRLPLSRSVLGRLFRKRENSSLQEYLNKKRLLAAKSYLEKTDMSVQEIALGCGFVEEINLNRMFKKYVHMTPGEYRRKSRVKITKNVIDNSSHHLYNEEGPGNPVKFDRDGEFTMFGQARSKQIVVAAAMSLLLLLSACTSGTPANNGGSTIQSGVQAQQTAGAEAAIQGEHQVRVVKTVMGDIEVPVDPQRVYVVSEVGNAVTLQASLVGVGRHSEGTIFDELLLGIPNHGYDDFNAEAVMALNPDLIILNGDTDYEKAAKIAPTVVIQERNLTGEQVFLEMANALNQTERAEQMIKAFNTKLDEGKRKLEAAGLYDKTITVIHFNSDESRFINTPQSWKGAIFYHFLELNAPEIVEQNIFSGNQNAMISMEAIPEYANGDIVWMANYNNYVVPESNAVWHSLPAVLNDSLIESTSAVFNSRDYLSLDAQLDEVVGRLLEWAEKQ